MARTKQIKFKRSTTKKAVSNIERELVPNSGKEFDENLKQRNICFMDEFDNLSSIGNNYTSSECTNTESSSDDSNEAIATYPDPSTVKQKTSRGRKKPQCSVSADKIPSDATVKDPPKPTRITRASRKALQNVDMNTMGRRKSKAQKAGSCNPNRNAKVKKARTEKLPNNQVFISRGFSRNFSQSTIESPMSPIAACRLRFSQE